MPKPSPTGYVAFQELNRARIANVAARQALSRIIDEKPGPNTLALLLARAATQLNANHEALWRLEKIMKGEKLND